MKIIRLIPLFVSLTMSAQNTPPKDPLQSLAFLQGTWEAKATGNAGIAVNGSYTFATELNGHVLARHTASSESCKGPASYDCDHGDLLYIYPEGPQQALKAIYFDNEGHVIHYDVTTPTSSSAVFLSDSSQAGPQFRLIYELHNNVMSGKFQIRAPGQNEWKSYLEWSGNRH